MDPRAAREVDEPLEFVIAEFAQLPARHGATFEVER